MKRGDVKRAKTIAVQLMEDMVKMLGLPLRCSNIPDKAVVYSGRMSFQLDPEDDDTCWTVWLEASLDGTKAVVYLEDLCGSEYTKNLTFSGNYGILKETNWKKQSSV